MPRTTSTTQLKTRSRTSSDERTKAELLIALDMAADAINAAQRRRSTKLANEKLGEFVKIVHELGDRFPGWNKPKGRAST